MVMTTSDASTVSVASTFGRWSEMSMPTSRIAAMAEAFHIQVAPHCYCGPIVAAANIQLATTLPNFLIIEAIKQFDGFHETLLEKKIEWQDGHVIPSKEPGLGVVLNEAILDDYPWSGPQLHLSLVEQVIGGSPPLAAQ